jgi:hypothetical protein
MQSSGSFENIAKRREDNWNSSPFVVSESKPRPKSASSIQRIKGSSSSTRPLDNLNDRPMPSFDAKYRVELRRNFVDLQLGPIDKRVFGLYHLNPEQEEIYRKFVDMISSFDDFDKVRSLTCLHIKWLNMSDDWGRQIFYKTRSMSPHMHQAS